VAGSARKIGLACGDDRGRSSDERGFPGAVRGASVAFSPDGTLAVIDGGQGVDLWNATTQRLTAALTKADDSADAMAFSPDGRVLAVDGLNGDTALWDVTSGHLIADLDNPSG